MMLHECPQSIEIHVHIQNPFRHQMARRSSREDYNQTNLDDFPALVFAHCIRFSAWFIPLFPRRTGPPSYDLFQFPFCLCVYGCV